MEEILLQIKGQQSNFLQVELCKVLQVGNIVRECSDFGCIGLNQIIFVYLGQPIGDLVCPHITENIETSEIIFLIVIKLNREKLAFAFEDSLDFLDEEFETFNCLEVHVKFLEEVDLPRENILQKREFTDLVVID